MAFDPNRLYSQLLNTGLANKDQPHYQLIRSIIQSLSDLSSSSSSSSSGTTGATGPAGPRGPQGLPGISDDFIVEENFMQLITSTGGSNIVDTYGAPVTNGDATFPELVFDSFGDVVMVTGLTTP